MSKAKSKPEDEVFPGVEPPNDKGPFDGNSIHLAVTREINVSQLQEEISQRTRSEVEVALKVDDISHIASKDRPATLFVSPGSLNERVVQTVIENHVAKQVGQAQPSPSSQDDAPGFNVETLPADAQELVQKLADGKDLKASESSNLLRAILGIETKS